MNTFTPLSQTLAPIPERADVTRELFEAEILPAARPVVMRRLVSDWPLVKAGRQSPEALFGYIRRFDRGNSVPTMLAPPSAKGRFFYSSDLTGFNFRPGQAKLAAVLDFLLSSANEDHPSAMAAQSVQVGQNLPGLQLENPMPLLDKAIDPRVWISNQSIVAAHHDPSENIACVAAGRRRFTLFPPEQVANLYVGPFELTPAGATISMVSLEEPDFEKYPRFADALAAAQTAELEPGDAIFIPYHWWHHVRSIEPVNVLVNYWWTPPAQGRGEPREAFFHAMLAIKDLPEPHRKAWRALFEHYVFQAEGTPGEHLPPDRRGIMGRLDSQAVRTIRGMLSRALAKI